MKNVLSYIAAALILGSGPAWASEWKGTISDAKCAAGHDASKHDGTATSHRDCVEKCVRGGQKYVFVSGGKTYRIANQDFAGLKAHAAHEVVVTGDMKDDTITVSRIEMPRKDAPKK